MEAEVAHRLQALNEALKAATACGLLDDLQCACKNPDSINDVCDAVDEFLKSGGAPKPNEYGGGDAIVKLPGSTTSFKCHCGGNVFSKHSTDPLRYRCNSCLTTYEGEK